MESELRFITKHDEPPHPAWPTKKSRSRRPRIKRRVVLLPFTDEVEVETEQSAPEADSSSSSYLPSVVTAESNLQSSKNVKKRGREANERVVENPAGEFRRITRMYARKIGTKIESGGVSFSDENNAKLKHDGIQMIDSDPRRKAESSCVSEKSLEISRSSVTELIPIADRSQPAASPEVSQGSAVGVAEINPKLVCSEQFSGDGEGSAYSTCNEMTLSEFESELFGGSSEEYFSDLSQSFLTESSDNFSEKSHDEKSSLAFSLYLGLVQQFSHSDLPEAVPALELDDTSEFTLLRFENEDDEESYQLFRTREKRIQLYDFADDQSVMKEYYAMVFEERLVMVQWIVEHSSSMQLQNETLFLGVSLMDRFLRKGFFKTKRNIHLLGIACITLATRIEENQPYNSVRRKTFLVGNCAYGRGEVVAMEWLVQEVLDFQCFAPTIYNFLWFYLKAAKAEPAVESLAKYLAVMSLLDHDRLQFWPSTVAAGVVVLASLASNRDNSCQWVMETHVRTRNDDLPECIKSLEWLIKHHCKK